MLSTLTIFLILTIFAFVYQNVYLSQLIFLWFLVRKTKTYMNTIIALLIIYAIIRVINYIVHDIIHAQKETIKPGELKTGDVISWLSPSKAFPLPDLVGVFSQLTLGIGHVAIVNNGYVIHSVQRLSREKGEGSADETYIHEKVEISKFMKQYKHKTLFVRPIKRQAYIKELDMEKLTSKKDTIIDKLYWLLFSAILRFGIVTKYNKKLTKYGCISFVKEIQKQNNIKSSDYEPRRKLLIA